LKNHAYISAQLPRRSCISEWLKGSSKPFIRSYLVVIVTNDAKVRLGTKPRVIISVLSVVKGDVMYVQECSSNTFRMEHALFEVRPN
jgi:hypothetical protein